MSQRNAERIGTVAARDFAALHRVIFKSVAARVRNLELTALAESAAHGCSSMDEGATLLAREFAGTCGGA
jgi:hypothetical protein